MTTSVLSILATLAVGLTSGLSWAFSIAVMPGLRDTDDRSFVSVMQAINRRILNIWFLPVFMGSLLLPIAAAIALFAGDNSDARRWGVASAILAAIPFALTVGGNVPRTTTLDAAGNANTINDPAALAALIRTVLVVR